MSLKSILTSALDSYDALRKSDKTIPSSDRSDESYLSGLRKKVKLLPENEYALDEKEFNALADQLTSHAAAMVKSANGDKALGAYRYRIVVLFEILDAAIMALQVSDQSSQDLFDANLDIYLKSFMDGATAFINDKFSGKTMTEADFHPYDDYYSTVQDIFLQIEQLGFEATEEAVAQDFVDTPASQRTSKWLEELEAETLKLRSTLDTDRLSVADCLKAFERASRGKPSELVGTVRGAKGTGGNVTKLDFMCNPRYSLDLRQNPMDTARRRKADLSKRGTMKSPERRSVRPAGMRAQTNYFPSSPTTPTKESTKEKEKGKEKEKEKKPVEDKSGMTVYQASVDILRVIDRLGLKKFTELWDRMHEVLSFDYKLMSVWGEYVAYLHTAGSAIDPALETLYVGYCQIFRAPLFDPQTQQQYLATVQAGGETYRNAIKMSAETKSRAAFVHAECATQLLSVRFVRPISHGEQADSSVVRAFYDAVIDRRLVELWTAISSTLHQAFEMITKGYHGELIEMFGGYVLQHQAAIESDLRKKFEKQTSSSTLKKDSKEKEKEKEKEKNCKSDKNSGKSGLVQGPH